MHVPVVFSGFMFLFVMNEKFLFVSVPLSLLLSLEFFLPSLCLSFPLILLQFSHLDPWGTMES